jgi:hypothetical protein
MTRPILIDRRWGKSVLLKTRSLNPFRAGDQTLCDETLQNNDYYGEKGFFRHLRTQFSQRPNALWLDYVLPV